MGRMSGRRAGQFPEADLNAQAFAKKFRTAVNIANVDVSRATTHNKGIFNGVDAVVLATGNDFGPLKPAVMPMLPATDNTAASVKRVSQTVFSVLRLNYRWQLEPLAVLHVSTRSASVHWKCWVTLAKELMKIMASVGLAQNFCSRQGW